MDQNLFVNYFELLKNMHQQLFLLMKLMRLEQNGKNLLQWRSQEFVSNGPLENLIGNHSIKSC